MTVEATGQPSKTKSKRPIIFLGVGILNTLLDFCFYTLLMLTVFRGGSVILAGILSGTFALACAFATHSFITWRGTNISHKTLLKFIFFTGFGMWVLRPFLLNLFSGFNALYDWAYKLSQSLGLPFSHEFIVSTGAFCFMVIVILVYNYLTYDRFVFTNNKNDQTNQQFTDTKKTASHETT